MGNQFTPRCFTAQVALRRQGGALAKSEVADTLVVGQQIADRVVAVVHDDQFTLWVALAQEIMHRLTDEAAAIARRHDATDRRFGDQSSPLIPTSRTNTAATLDSETINQAGVVAARYRQILCIVPQRGVNTGEGAGDGRVGHSCCVGEAAYDDKADNCCSNIAANQTMVKRAIGRLS
jgi:hypothetical protein